jgi:putative membrane protein
MNPGPPSKGVVLSSTEDADGSTFRSSSEQGARTRDHLANRRTLLAWVRTGVSLIGFGLVIERFAAETNPNGGSVAFGVALAALGCVALAVGMVDFIRTRRDIAAENLTTAASAGGYMVVASASLVFAGAFIAYVFLRLP